ncbi:MAG TPA: methylated-DNA--[protein]-cysteine S-methyltransferase [bacterium]|nr:methylated-DNA--[protein]-cysteine S-methyltransferase [bacterium]HMW34927.1 methylated-DNA--[protein]-cysteine S-methyltransferase [bacterium]HMY36273.1 methylated-DNA--[protein]-cysteine S-methyltransferase [bacterium]HMZ04806.1 methylated-DNA--[protein]-cysteine S-methyltransferase [bacterium]HNB09468.1 methylated-DNA--[protein]-cysteine S-methyltransferase [bacterium]
METQEQINYKRIAEAIEYIRVNFKEQPDLDDVAKKVHVSPFHFQRLFTAWAGVSPKKFLQFTTIDYAKSILKDRKISLMDAAMESGLSGTSRLHDLFVNIEGMTPGEYKNGGENLEINYSFSESPFGDILSASTSKGLCYMMFSDDPKSALSQLVSHFPNATYHHKKDSFHKNALNIFNVVAPENHSINLHLKGSEFQLKVWEALLKIPFGKLTTYNTIAKEIRKPKASRAVGTAIGSNPVAYLIPCHRVIQSSGNFGGYMWGPTRKTAIIGWEAAKISAQHEIVL